MKKVAIIAAVLLFTAAFVHAQNTVQYMVALNGGQGWTAWASDGEQGGGVSRRQTEALRIRVTSDLPGTVKYRVNVSGKWSDWMHNNEIAGVPGTNRIEGIQIELTGELDDKFDIQYSVLQGGTWSTWVANGDTAGAPGSNRFVEGVSIVLSENRAGRRPQGGKRAAPPPPPSPPGQRGGRR